MKKERRQYLKKSKHLQRNLDLQKEQTLTQKWKTGVQNYSTSISKAQIMLHQIQNNDCWSWARTPQLFGRLENALKDLTQLTSEDTFIAALIVNDGQNVKKLDTGDSSKVTVAIEKMKPCILALQQATNILVGMKQLQDQNTAA